MVTGKSPQILWSGVIGLTQETDLLGHCSFSMSQRLYNEMNAMLFPEYKVNCFIRPDDHHAIAGDVSSKDSVSECFKQILEKYKRAPDIVVNSAGITKDGFLLRMKEEDFEQVMLEGS